MLHCSPVEHKCILFIHVKQQQRTVPRGVQRVCYPRHVAANQPDAAVVRPVDVPQGSSHCPHDAHVSRIIKRSTDCGPIQHYGRVHHYFGFTKYTHMHTHKGWLTQESNVRLFIHSWNKKLNLTLLVSELILLHSPSEKNYSLMRNGTEYLWWSIFEVNGCQCEIISWNCNKTDLSLALQVASWGFTSFTAPTSHSRSQRVLLPVNSRFPRHSSTPMPKTT